MLEELDGSFRDFLHAEVPLRADVVDIEFALPDKDWSSRLSRSTVNMFLFDVRRSTSRGVTGQEMRQRNDGVYERRQLAPLVKVRYMLTVWTAEASDEHRVLGEVLRLLAVSGDVPAQYLLGDLGDLSNPVELALGAEDGLRASELWSPLGIAPRANIELILTLPARPPISRQVPVPPTELESAVGDRGQETRQSRRRSALVEEPASGTSRGIGGK